MIIKKNLTYLVELLL